MFSALMLGACGLSSPASADPGDFAYQPLWPFAAQADADRWLHEHSTTGSSPWHSDPEATALLFTQNYLGFHQLDRATTVTTQAHEAWVGVGSTLPNGTFSAAATLHLARFGSAPNAPWEVVGSDDGALTLSAPPYGSTVGPEIDAGGTIDGVDESLHVQVRQIGQQNPLGDRCCLPAGGRSQPWSATITTSPPQPGTLTLVVWTGGHRTDVEKFAITGLRAS